MRAHFAETYPLWALGVFSLALPALALGLLVERLAGLVRRRPRPSYLGDWPTDYDVVELAQLVDREAYAVAQTAGLDALRAMSSS